MIAEEKSKRNIHMEAVVLESVFDLKAFQAEQREWSERNFGGKYGSGYRPLLGALEELGELAHAHLKSEQGIRNTECHAAAKRDAVADVIIYLADYCSNEGIDLEAALRETWLRVRSRDWKRNPDDAHKKESE